MMHFHFFAPQGKAVSGAFCFSHFMKSFCYVLNTLFCVYKRVTEQKMEIFMYPFLSVSFSFFSQNEWLDSRGAVSPDQQLSCYLVFEGCTKIKRLQAEKPWEFNIGSWIRLQAAFLPPGESVQSSLELPFLILPGNMHH